MLYYPTVVFLFSLLDFSVFTSCFYITTFLLWQLNILNDRFLGGDEEIKTNDAYFLAVSSKLSEIIDVKEAKIGPVRVKELEWISGT